MSFLSTAFLYGLAAAAIPLVIHLIQRQRYPERQFTTLRFFDKTIKNNTLQRRIIDRILLLLRIAALIAIVLGLSRPFWRTPLGEQRGSFVIVLDNSPSMSRERDGVSLFEHGKKAAEQILKTLGPSDRAEILFTAPLPEPLRVERKKLEEELRLRQGTPAALLVAGAKGLELSVPELTTDLPRLEAALQKSSGDAALIDCESAPAPQFSSDLAALLSILQQSRLSAQPGNLKKTLSLAAQLLRTSQDGDRKIILISDMQKSELQGDKAETQGISVLALPFEPSSAGANLGIESCSVPVGETDFGQTIVGSAVLRNYGAEASDAATLTIHCGDKSKPVEIKIAAIQPGGTLVVSFPIQVMSSERNLLCKAQLNSPTDTFVYDNSWYFQVGVRFPVVTLLVNGTPSETLSNRESFYLTNALVPRAGSGQSNAADVRECDVAEFKDRRLAEFGVLILAGVPMLDADAREKIRQFISDGKSVLVFPGTKTSPEEYNAWGFLPAQIQEVKSKSFTYVLSVNEKTSAMKAVHERLGAGVHSLSTQSRLVLEPAAQAQVLARFADETPALVEGALGKGRVIFAATSAHASSSDWPLRPA
ncbi:MAG TPA: BatA domain-containing protein, partial [Planctomycetota bacterium]|nr:BatA domain-containing protein [Planctomycetota bacterium]